MSVRPLEVTTQVLIDDIRNFSKEHLQLYFEKEGDLEDVVLNEMEHSVVITFKDYQGI